MEATHIKSGSYLEKFGIKHLLGINLWWEYFYFFKEKHKIQPAGDNPK